MIINNDKRYQLNSIIITFFLFQYSLLIPVMYLLSPKIVCAISGSICMIVLFVFNAKNAISYKILLFFLISFLIIGIKMLISFETSVYFPLYFVIYTVPAGIVFLYQYSCNYILKYGYYFSLINFVINAAGPWLPWYEYMRFGYGMLITAVFLFYEIARDNSSEISPKKNTIFNIVVICFSLFEMIIYGSRGATFSFLVFVFIYLIIIERKHIVRNSIIISGSILLLFKIEKILRFLQMIALKIGIRSYALGQYINQLNSKWEIASSGRNQLYSDAISKFYEHPILGNAIRPESYSGAYAHNLFIQVAQDLGIFAVVILILFLVVIIISVFNNKTEYSTRVVFAIFFSISIGRLMFSSVLWERPEFWMLICLYLTSGLQSNNKLLHFR